jgi:hypothetical protein
VSRKAAREALVLLGSGLGKYQSHAWLSAAVALGHVLGLARPLAVPCLSLPPAFTPYTLSGQVPCVPALPGDWLPQAGGEP